MQQAGSRDQLHRRRGDYQDLGLPGSHEASPVAKVAAALGSPSHPYLLASFIAAAIFVEFAVFFPSADKGEAANADLPQRIKQTWGSSIAASMQSPSLRGCCGAPTEFHWVFLDSTDSVAVGSPFRTRVLALDAKGRQAQPSACGQLRVHVGLSGRARLSGATSPNGPWHNAELNLDIESDHAEVVQAEVRIEHPDPNADTLLHSSQIRFVSGPVHSFAIRLQHTGSSATATGGNSWPTASILEVFVSTQDRFGNPANWTDADVMDIGGLVAQSRFALRSNSRSLEVFPPGGELAVGAWRDGRTGVSIRCREAGLVELWLEQVGGNATRQQRQALRERTARRIEFFEVRGPPAASGKPSSAKKRPEDAKWAPVAAEVREAFLHGWRSYRRHAWGLDELQPLSKRGRDTFGGLGITILDSLTTLWLMGLQTEFEQATAFVENDLDFDKADTEVSVFELIIRALGGLLGAHSLSGRPIFLQRAMELADRLLPALNSSSHLPFPKWNIARGRGPPAVEPTILSEAGSMQLELRYLSAQTGDPRYQRAGDACFDAIQATGVTGLVPVYLTPPDHVPPRAVRSKVAVGALADSYYEYLLKQWLQNRSEVRFKELWLQVLDEAQMLLRPKPGSEPPSRRATAKYKLVEVGPSATIWKMDHLSCFTPAMIALGLNTLPRHDLVEKNRNSTWWDVAKGLTASCVELWTFTKSGLAPEHAMVRASPPHDFREVPANARHSFLRPETVESLFYLYRYTRDETYRRQGAQIFRAIMNHSKVDAGFASVKDVTQVPTQKLDEMQTFVLAETFKYLYLLFSPDDALDLDRFVLNTEAHPLRKNTA